MNTHLHEHSNLDVHIWGDSCNAQSRSGYVFKLTTILYINYNVVRYYNEHHHGKGIIDSVGECAKNAVYRAVMADREVIKCHEELVNCAQKLLKGITWVYLPVEEVFIEPEEVQETPYNLNR